MSVPAARPLQEWIKVGGRVTCQNQKRLKYKLIRGAPLHVQTRWEQFYHDAIEWGSDRDAIMNEWTRECTLNENKTLALQSRCESCLGGNENKLHKQVRGRFDGSWSTFEDGEIGFTLNNAWSEDKENGEKWTREQAEDLRDAFLRVLLRHMSK